MSSKPMTFGQEPGRALNIEAELGLLTVGTCPPELTAGQETLSRASRLGFNVSTTIPGPVSRARSPR